MAQAEKRKALGCSVTANRPAGRPLTPPDPRVEAAKAWPPRAREAAKAGFDAAKAAGRTHEQAIEAGYQAGLREISSKGATLIEAAKSVLGAKVVGIVEPGTYPPIYDRCFEMFFPEFPEPRSESRVDSKPTEGVKEEIPQAPTTRQATLDFGTA